MAGFVEGIGREQTTLFPARLDDYVADDNPVRAVDAFVDGLDLGKLGFMQRRSRSMSAGPATIPRRCSSSTSTATSTAFRRAAASNASVSATSS